MARNMAAVNTIKGLSLIMLIMAVGLIIGVSLKLVARAFLKGVSLRLGAGWIIFVDYLGGRV